MYDPPVMSDPTPDITFRLNYQCQDCRAFFHIHLGRPNLCYRCGAMNFRLVVAKISVVKYPWYKLRSDEEKHSFVRFADAAVEKIGSKP
jgi:hypothetical protein